MSNKSNKQRFSKLTAEFEVVTLILTNCAQGEVETKRFRERQERFSEEFKQPLFQGYPFSEEMLSERGRI